ncbi:MAG: DUF488 family protein [Betaproteobacteria bacterium]|jgi:uncharacterized protein YeaO (DUF488 family)
MEISIKRVYAPVLPQDGYRILVDRLWPRGLAKASAHVDLWMKDIGPSDALRRWFDHDPKRWQSFRARYFRELDSYGGELVATVLLYAQAGRVTLLYAVRDERHNQALALNDYLLLCQK